MKQTAHPDRRDTGRHDQVRHRSALWSKSVLPNKCRDGWVRNVSDDGISLVIRNTARPKVGERLKISYDGNAALYTVVRRKKTGTTVSVVGCRMEMPARP